VTAAAVDGGGGREGVTTAAVDGGGAVEVAEVGRGMAALSCSHSRWSQRTPNHKAAPENPTPTTTPTPTPAKKEAGMRPSNYTGMT